MNTEEFLENNLKSLIILNIFSYEFKKAAYWKSILDTAFTENNFSLNIYIIMRLTFTEDLTSELTMMAKDCINSLSIEDPMLYDDASSFISALRKKID